MRILIVSDGREPQGNGVVQDFEKGSLSWAPGVPVTVTRR